MKKRYLECGKIVSLHGIHGEVRLQSWCDSPEYLLNFKRLYLDNGSQFIPIIKARIHKNMLILNIDGINNIDDAVTLRGKILYIDREDAPDDEDGVFFIQDLIGINVYDADTERLWGTLTDVLVTGANDVYEITDSDGTKRLAPVIPQVIIDTNIEENKMLIRPLKGLFDDED